MTSWEIAFWVLYAIDGLAAVIVMQRFSKDLGGERLGWSTGETLFRAVLLVAWPPFAALAAFVGLLVWWDERRNPG